MKTKQNKIKQPAMEMEKHRKGGQMRNKRGYIPETKRGFKHDFANLDSILKTRDITFPTKVYLVKVMVFPVVM